MKLIERLFPLHVQALLLLTLLGQAAHRVLLAQAGNPGIVVSSYAVVYEGKI